MVPLLLTKTLRRCCPLLWRPSKKDRHTKKINKIPPPQSVLAPLCPPWRRFVWPIGNTDPGPVHSCHKMEHVQTEPVGWNISRWNGGERKVIGPPTSLCRSLERHLAVASYVSIARFPTRWIFFLFLFKHSIQSQKKVITQKNTASSRESWTIIFVLMSYIVFSHNGAR